MEGTKQVGLLPDVDRNKYFHVMRKALVSIILLAFALTMVFPLLFMVSSSFKSNAEVFEKPFEFFPEKPYLENYIKIFHNEYYFRWYLNSILVVVMTVVARTFLVTLAAYAFSRLRFRGRDIIFLGLLATMMIPYDTTIVARFLMYKYIGIIDTLWAIFLPATFDVYFIFMMRQFLRGIPFELSEAAYIDGCSHFRIYYRIILPLAVPALLTMALFTFIWVWNDFVNPYVFISSIDRQLVTVGLQYFQGRAGANYALQMAGGTFGVLFPLLIFIFSQKSFVQGIATSGLKG
jgi:multiple sugar transport system permease protein